MAKVADYAIIMDGTGTAVRGGTNFFRQNFTVPSNLDQGGRGVLMYRVEAENADGLKYTISLNDNDVLTLTHSTDRFGTIHEVIPGDSIHSGDNKFQVVATNGHGTLKISDVVVFFQGSA